MLDIELDQEVLLVVPEGLDVVESVLLRELALGEAHLDHDHAFVEFLQDHLEAVDLASVLEESEQLLLGLLLNSPLLPRGKEGH